jgi:hypothetical protein
VLRARASGLPGWVAGLLGASVTAPPTCSDRTLRLVLRCGPLGGAADRLMSALAVLAATASIVDRSRPR